MTSKKRTIFTLRIKLAMVIGGLAGLGLVLFGQYVAMMDDSPNGRTPLSWMFKSNSANVAAFFRSEEPMPSAYPPVEWPTPLIDRNHPEQTEFALFALG